MNKVITASDAQGRSNKDVLSLQVSPGIGLKILILEHNSYLIMTNMFLSRER